MVERVIVRRHEDMSDVAAPGAFLITLVCGRRLGRFKDATRGGNRPEPP